MYQKIRETISLLGAANIASLPGTDYKLYCEDSTLKKYSKEVKQYELVFNLFNKIEKHINTSGKIERVCTFNGRSKSRPN